MIAGISKGKNLGFLATSPPAWNPNMPPTPQPMLSPLATAAQTHVNKISSTNKAHQNHEVQSSQDNVSTVHGFGTNQEAPTGTTREEQPLKDYVSKIGILTTSLPMYHNQLMDMKKADEKRRQAEAKGELLEPREAEMLSKMSLGAGPDEQQSEEQQAFFFFMIIRHSRSTLHINAILSSASQNPEETTVHPAKAKGRSTRWQFGIRSKNEPVDAVKCLYKALKSMRDCQWHVSPPKSQSEDFSKRNKGPYPVNVAGATHLNAGESTLSESPEKARHHMRDAHHETQANGQDFGGDDTPNARPANIDTPIDQDDSDSENDDDVDIYNPPPGYLPKDPWCIHVRWEKKGMSPPGAMSNNSARSSHIDLNSNSGSARRGSIALGSLSSAAGSTTSVAEVDLLSKFDTDTACFVYLDLQIYVLEENVYLVDFKCAGYESIVGSRDVTNKKGEIVTEYIGSGVRIADKDVTSPQPFMDLANKLVIYLAKGNQ